MLMLMLIMMKISDGGDVVQVGNGGVLGSLAGGGVVQPAGLMVKVHVTGRRQQGLTGGVVERRVQRDGWDVDEVVEATYSLERESSVRR